MLCQKNNVDFKTVFAAKCSNIGHTKTTLAAKFANFHRNVYFVLGGLKIK
jgi:hypothetical protein